MKLSRYEWRSTELLRGDTPEAKRYWFRPPEGLRWALLRPLTHVPGVGHHSGMR